MKTDIHPQYFDTQFQCACGNSWLGGGTTPSMKLEICSNCHPFYTGKDKVLDARGRIEKFKKRMAQASKKVLGDK